MAKDLRLLAYVERISGCNFAVPQLVEGLDNVGMNVFVIEQC